VIIVDAMHYKTEF